jgi:hypothetical protein
MCLLTTRMPCDRREEMKKRAPVTCMLRESRLPRTHGRAPKRGDFRHSVMLTLYACQVNETWCMLDPDLMRPIRRRLSWMLASWLVFQCAGIVAPVVLAATGVALEEACTCPGAIHGATCPMHHGKESTAKDKANPCSVRNAYLPSDLALLALSGGAAVLPQLLAFDAIAPSRTPISLQADDPSSRTELPDSPPPRA